MNRGINDSKDLPPEYLEDIYNQIKSKEIALKPRRTTKVAVGKGKRSTKILYQFCFKPSILLNLNSDLCFIVSQIDKILLVDNGHESGQIIH